MSLRQELRLSVLMAANTSMSPAATKSWITGKIDRWLHAIMSFACFLTPLIFIYCSFRQSPIYSGSSVQRQQTQKASALRARANSDKASDLFLELGAQGTDDLVSSTHKDETSPPIRLTPSKKKGKREKRKISPTSYFAAVSKSCIWRP